MKIHRFPFARGPVISLIPRLSAVLIATSAFAALGQGLPPEARTHIHALFSQHTNIVRNVTLTDDGYVAVTESNDPALARILRKHVSEMRRRLQSGRAVRGWDPAFRELVGHYDDITHRVEPTPKGLKMIVRGKTPEAILVAQNHAHIVSAFAENGWEEHDVRHSKAAARPAVETSEESLDKCKAACCSTAPAGVPGSDHNPAGGCANCHSASQ